MQNHNSLSDWLRLGFSVIDVTGLPYYMRSDEEDRLENEYFSCLQIVIVSDNW